MKVKLPIFFAIVLFSSVLWANDAGLEPLLELVQKVVESTKHELEQEGYDLNNNMAKIFLIHFPKWLELKVNVEHAIKQEDYDEGLKWAEKLYDYAHLHFRIDEHSPIFLILQVHKDSADVKTTMLTMNIARARQKGDYQKALKFAQESYNFTREYFGSKDERAILSSVILGGIYSGQGHFIRAESLLKQGFSLAQEVLGETHFINVFIFEHLAGFARNQGNYGEAESYYNNAYSLGKKLNYNPLYLRRILTDLMDLYFSQNRFEDAKSIYLEIDSLGQLSTHDVYITPQVTLDGPLVKGIMEMNKYVFEDLTRIKTFQNLAVFAFEYQELHTYAKRGLDEALSISEDKFGPKHPYTIGVLHNLAQLPYYQKRYHEAESSLKKVYLLEKEVLGAKHPNTLNTKLTLAFLYYYQGHHQKSVSLFEETLPSLKNILGFKHPGVQFAYLNYAMVLVNLNQYKESVKLLKRMEPVQLFYAKSQFYTTHKERVRRALFTRLTTSFHSVVLGLVQCYPDDKELIQFATNVLLRWKQVQAEEEAVIAKLLHNPDPKIVALTTKIKQKRAKLSHKIYQVDNIDDISKVTEELETAELELAQKSESYQKLSETLKIPNIYREVRQNLLPKSALIEFKAYLPVDFSNGQSLGAPLHWMAFLLTKDKVLFKDLGSLETTRSIWEKLSSDWEKKISERQLTDEDSKKYTAEIYQNLFGAFDEHIKEFDSVYIAPDGFLNLVPFSTLILPDGRYWIERQILRQLQTGRDLLREKPKPSSELLLLAIGGINFTEYPESVKPDSSQKSNSSQSTGGLVEGKEYFRLLPGASQEVQDIATKFPSAKIWKGSKTNEGNLKALTQVPRVLHFATHAFYNDKSTDNTNIVRPLTLSGIALAGAEMGLNGELDPDKEDGIFYALEALNLNLIGTELVVFSACETGKGVMDYSEGVYGLVRAFKIAGAYRILMTLWEVDNHFSKEFMIEFYENWRKKPDDPENQVDPAVALRQTQLCYINELCEIKESFKQYKATLWGAYVMVGP